MSIKLSPSTTYLIIIIIIIIIINANIDSKYLTQHYTSQHIPSFISPTIGF
jgi:hypothetical protein